MNDNSNPTRQVPSGFDVLLDGLQEAIVSSRCVFVRPSSRRMAAAFRRDLFGEPEPPQTASAAFDVETSYEPVAALALNVMVGLVHRRLATLGSPPGDEEAVDVVSAWLGQVVAGTGDEAALLSSMHMALRARPHLTVVDRAGPPAVDTTQVPAELWQSILAMLARAAPPTLRTQH